LLDPRLVEGNGLVNVLLRQLALCLVDTLGLDREIALYWRAGIARLLDDMGKLMGQKREAARCAWPVFAGGKGDVVPLGIGARADIPRRFPGGTVGVDADIGEGASEPALHQGAGCRLQSAPRPGQGALDALGNAFGLPGPLRPRQAQRGDAREALGQTCGAPHRLIGGMVGLAFIGISRPAEGEGLQPEFLLRAVVAAAAEFRGTAAAAAFSLED